ncbi:MULTISPECIES: hypothetical protein [unclassified Kitasatospora]|uniref:hypothetical protein n=1 Tax=unclassified Kitasatospora TaxID=2633591 RepID=UPI0033C00C11
MEFLVGLEVSVLWTVVTAAEVHVIEFGFAAAPDGDLDDPVPGFDGQPCAVLGSVVFWGVPQFGGDPTRAENRVVLGEPCRERDWEVKQSMAVPGYGVGHPNAVVKPPR